MNIHYILNKSTPFPTHPETVMLPWIYLLANLRLTSPSLSVVGQSRPPSKLGSMTYLVRDWTPLPQRPSVRHSVHDVQLLSWQSRAQGTKHISSMYSAPATKKQSQEISRYWQLRLNINYFVPYTLAEYEISSVAPTPWGTGGTCPTSTNGWARGHRE